MRAKNHLLIFSSFLDIWENVEWPRFFWTTRYLQGDPLWSARIIKTNPDAISHVHTRYSSSYISLGMYHILAPPSYGRLDLWPCLEKFGCGEIFGRISRLLRAVFYVELFGTVAKSLGGGLIRSECL